MLACGCALILACVPSAGPDVSPLVFLTRDDCVNTPTMRARLDEALTALGRPRDYLVINADTLEPDDRRRGYGTPTILVGNVDLFGMPEPAIHRDAAT